MNCNREHFIVDLNDEDVARARLHAVARAQNNPKRRYKSKTHVLDMMRSVCAEWALAVLFGGDMDWGLYDRGGRGYDLMIMRQPIKVKATGHPHGVLQLHNERYMTALTRTPFYKDIILALAVVEFDAAPIKARASARVRFVGYIQATKFMARSTGFRWLTLRPNWPRVPAMFQHRLTRPDYLAEHCKAQLALGRGVPEKGVGHDRIPTK